MEGKAQVESQEPTQGCSPDSIGVAGRIPEADFSCLCYPMTWKHCLRMVWVSGATAPSALKRLLSHRFQPPTLAHPRSWKAFFSVYSLEDFSLLTMSGDKGHSVFLTLGERKNPQINVLIYSTLHLLVFKQTLQSPFLPPSLPPFLSPPCPNAEIMVPNLGHCHNLYPQQDDISLSNHSSSHSRGRVKGLGKKIRACSIFPSFQSLPWLLLIVLIHCGFLLLLSLLF